MTESFAELFESSQASIAKLKPGAIVSGVIVEMRSDVVVVNAGWQLRGDCSEATIERKHRMGDASYKLVAYVDDRKTDREPSATWVTSPAVILRRSRYGVTGSVTS